jgi:hypothetical protein
MQRDFLRRLEKFPSPTSALQTFTSFIRLSTLPCISRSSIPQLLKRLCGGSISSTLSAPSHASEADLFAAAAGRVLDYVSRNRAGLYKSHTAELGKVLGAEGEGGEEQRTEAVLKALAGLKRVEEGVVVDSCVLRFLSSCLSIRLANMRKLTRVDVVRHRKLSKRAYYFAKEGTEKQAKYAATLVALDTGRAGTVDDLVDVRFSSLPFLRSAFLPSR